MIFSSININHLLIWIVNYESTHTISAREIKIVRTPTQPQHNLNLTQLSWVWHENGFAHPPPTPPKLIFHHKEPQINLWYCLNNNINIKDNNNKNSNFDDNNNNKTKQIS